MKRTLAVAGGLVAAALLALVGVLIVGVEVTPERATIAAAARSAIGRDLALDGPVTLRLSLHPTITLSDVAVGNAPWAGPEPMARVARVEARIALVPLLRGRVRLHRLVIAGAEVALARNRAGIGNWVLGEGGENGDFALAEDAEVVLTDTRASYRDRASGEVVQGRLDRLALTAAGDAFRVEIAGAVRGAAVAMEGTLVPGDGGLAVDGAGTLAGARLTVSGRIGGDTDLALTAAGDDIRALAHLAGPPIPLDAAFSARARLRVAQGAARLDDLALTLSRGEDARVTMTGTIGDLAAFRGVALAVRAEAPSLAAIAAMARTETPEIGLVAASFKLADSEGGFRLETIDATVGPDRVTGALTLALGGARPKLSGALTAAGLTLDPLLAGAPRPEGEARLLPATPLPFAALAVLDADIRLAAEAITLAGARFTLGAGRVTLENGKLSLSLDPLRYRKSAIAVTLEADARLDPPRVTLTLAAPGLDLGGLLGDLGVTDLVAMRADVSARLAGKGGSLRVLAATADGEAGLVSGAGRIRSAYVDFAAADLLAALAPWSRSDDDARITCALAAFNVADGIATARALRLDTERMTVAGSGTIDLRRERLDLVLDPKPRSPALLSLATPVRVTGRLVAPEIGPDPKALALGVAGAVAGVVASGGIGLIVPFLSPGAGRDNPCLAAPPGPQTTPPEAGAGPPATAAPGVLDRMDQAIQGFLGGAAPDQSTSPPASNAGK